MPWPTKKLRENQWRQQKALDAEASFENFCSDNDISYIRLENNKEARHELLKDPNGKCPDFLCTKARERIFVEVKAHTFLTNKARYEAMAKTIREKKAAGLSGTTIFAPFDSRPELKGVFEGYLRDASKKFKNIKEERTPRILLLSGYNVIGLDIQAIFWGAYPSFYQSGGYAGLKKEHRGLFDSTGSNVSAVIYWNEDTKRFEGIRNSRAAISLSEKTFKNFFDLKND